MGAIIGAATGMATLGVTSALGAGFQALNGSSLGLGDFTANVGSAWARSTNGTLQTWFSSSASAGISGAVAQGAFSGMAGGALAGAAASSGGGSWESSMRNQYEKGFDNGAICYDESTLGNNLGFGSKGHRASYPGSNNPMGYTADGRRVPYYGPVPNGTFLEYPGYIHDVAYMKLGIEGPAGLFTSLRAIPYDWRFVAQSLYLGTKHMFSDPYLSSQSDLIGVGLGVCALPKTLVIPAAIYGAYKLSE
jgi:hypothetical protein